MCQIQSKPYTSKKPLVVYKFVAMYKNAIGEDVCVSPYQVPVYIWTMGLNISSINIFHQDDQSGSDKSEMTFLEKATGEIHSGFHFFFDKGDAVREALNL